MKHALVITAGLVSAAMNGWSLQDQWSSLRQRVMDASIRGDVAGAVHAAERLLNVADSEFPEDRDRAFEALTLLSTQYRSAGAYGKEELARQRELRLWFVLKTPPPAADRSFATEAAQDVNEVSVHYSPMPLTDPTPLTLLGNMADQHCVAGRFKRCEALYRRVLDLRARSSDGGATSTTLHLLGELYLHLGRAAEAEPRFQEAVDLRRRVYGNRHFFVASSLLGLADARAATGRTGPAVEALQDALPIIQAEYGDAHPQPAYHLLRLAALLEQAGRRDEAVAARARAQAIRERIR